MSDTLIDNLKSFNRKERFYLIGQMLGNPEFRMDDNQLDKISNLIGLTIPRKYFAAMDYHLDWIYASLYLTKKNTASCVKRNFIEENGIAIDYQISGTHEDVDFLIAFVDHENTTHIVMIEAKGDSTFSNAQLQSKNERFRAIFYEPEVSATHSHTKWKSVKAHFLLCSPKKPRKIEITNPVSFMKSDKLMNSWLKLDMGEDKIKVTRCGKNDSGSYSRWVIEKRTISK